MSEEIETKMKDHTLTEFWGGDDKGVCLQITASTPMKLNSPFAEEGFTQLTMEEAAVLHTDLTLFIKREAERRMTLLKEVLDDMQLIEKTVFHEVLELSSDMGLGKDLCINMVSSLCPKVRKP